MRVPLNWLAELVELPQGATAESVMAELVKIGLEEEAVHGASLVGPITVGQVLSFEPETQSNGKTIRWCQVRVAPEGQTALDGGPDVRGVVCGASNFEVGDKVVVTLPGAVLPGGFQIAARKTYGHVSDGMIASQKELGMGEDHAGILVLSRLGLDPEVGVDAIELLALGQTAAEVNVTPDRGYCLSMRGIAREYSHATHQPFIDPVSKVGTHSVSGFDLKLQDEFPIRGRVGCSAFFALAVEGVDATAKTPPWMSSRLELAGMRSISIAVDISNYVMLELGQPNHTYDLDAISGGIEVRRAQSGEQLVTLDGKVRVLHPEDLVIADASGPIGLAGVMGGLSTEVQDSTTRVLIEAASFDPVSIARSARRHRLVSEASKRFERGVDTQLPAVVAARVAELLIDLAGGRLVTNSDGKLGGYVSLARSSSTISLPKGFAQQLVGVDYSPELCEQILVGGGCTVADRGDAWDVTPPTWRPDLEHKTDLVEEIARLRGYEHIPAVIPVAPPGAGLTSTQKLRRRLLSALSARGLIEVLNYPFVTENEVQALNPGAKAIRLENPIQEEAPFLRMSLLPGLLQAASRNRSRGQDAIFIFEEGSVFLPHRLEAFELPPALVRPSDSLVEKLNEAIPAQPRFIAALLTGEIWPQSPGQVARTADYSDAVAALELITQQSALDFELRPAGLPGWHPGRCAEVLIADQVIGVVGEIHPELAEQYHLGERVAAVELNLEALHEAEPVEVLAGELRIMPAATQDLSLLVPESVQVSELKAPIREIAGDWLETVSLLDVYRGPSLPADRKSVTFKLLFRAPDRTLTQQELSEVRQRIVDGLSTKFGAELRA